MNKTSFARIFQDAVEVACRSTEEALGRTLNRDVIVRMYGAGTNGLDVSSEEFIDRAYINDDVFYRLIDLMVVEVIGSRPVVFARISNHPPAQLSKCWNGEKGPFKQLTAEAIAQK
ncbi:hypothetical protein [Rhizobium ruizarguesonis]|uniref:hypothetical protein n=1 Tax=Rhizobium ruizarguesonis TaxID=2081791 RepID=UPI00102FA8FC|nr:hypothetical protein [Rhizobium ruizarguesonis]TBD34339.1 hypothetical protein ELH17_30605 [Rhizobium ruizarguesonis]TBD55055.1 hypothetical protein ELH16_34575 [Rhizobium ruizarguesonis]TBF01957.1 hypothetical protein ELG96_32425 [Rhizobium ruizarguesonis]